MGAVEFNLPLQQGELAEKICVTQDKNRYYTLILAKRPRSDKFKSSRNEPDSNIVITI